MGEIKRLDFQPFRFWCQKVLPAVYDDSLSYYDLLCKIVAQLNDVMSQTEAAYNSLIENNENFTTDMTNKYNELMAVWKQLQDWITNYFNNLDVQDEINNKLDAMAEDGTLTTLLLPYIAKYSSPIFVDNVDSMTDPNSVYVLTTNGHVYTYVGNNFVDSGYIYAISDDVLTFSTMLVGESNYTTLLPDANNVFAPIVYNLNFTYGSNNITANTPFGNTWGTSSVCTLMCIPVTNNNGTRQIFISDKDIYVRYYGNNTWQAWTNVDPDLSSYVESVATLIGGSNYTTLLPDANNIFVPSVYNLNFVNGSSNITANTPFGETWGTSSVCTLMTFPVTNNNGTRQIFVSDDNVYVRYYGNGNWFEWYGLVPDMSTFVGSAATLIGGSNYTTLLPDANNVFAPTVYNLNFTYGSNNITANTPFGETWGTSSVCTLMTFPVTNNNGTRQIFISDKDIYVRYYGNKTWQAWTNVDPDLSSYVESVATLIGGSNYTTLLPDANNIFVPSVYNLNFVNGSSNITANTPFGETWGTSSVCTLMTFPVTNNNGTRQIFISDKNIYVRYYGNGNWFEWNAIYQKYKEIIEIGAGKQFTTITEGFSYAYNTGNVNVIVNTGNYDLEAEFKAVYGENFFDNYTASSRKGLTIGNNMKVTFSENATIIFNYSGNNAEVMEEFSPINAGNGDFELINCNIECSNCRYAIHDELNSNTIPYTHVYDKVNLHVDNSNNTAWTSRQCIGGGLGENGSITIKNSVFKSEDLNSNTCGIVSYHNSASENAKSVVVVKDCYFEGIGTIRMSWYGNSNKITNCLITNNSIGSNLIFRAENGTALIENMRLIEWNNNLRS